LPAGGRLYVLTRLPPAISTSPAGHANRASVRLSAQTARCPPVSPPARLPTAISAPGRGGGEDGRRGMERARRNCQRQRQFETISLFLARVGRGRTRLLTFHSMPSVRRSHNMALRLLRVTPFGADQRALCGTSQLFAIDIEVAKGIELIHAIVGLCGSSCAESRFAHRKRTVRRSRASRHRCHKEGIALATFVVSGTVQPGPP